MSGPAQNRVPLIVTDENPLRDGIAAALRCRPSGFRHVAGLSELRDCSLDTVDFVVTSARLQDGHGLDVADLLMRRGVTIPTVIVFDTDESNGLEAALRAARGRSAWRVGVSRGREQPVIAAAVERTVHTFRQRSEIQELRRQLAEARNELRQSRQDFDEAFEQLEMRTRTDALTGLVNRRWLNIMLEGAFAEAIRHDLPLGCLMIDLDNFKDVNDTCGHPVGDEVLRMTGRVLQANCRNLDLAARYGGDEFCVLVPHAEPDECTAVAQRILEAYRIMCAGRTGAVARMSMTIGIAHTKVRRPANADELVCHADEALYAGKAAGKDVVAWGAAAGAVEG